jgi:hypothetical protein
VHRVDITQICRKGRLKTEQTEGGAGYLNLIEEKTVHPQDCMMTAILCPKPQFALTSTIIQPGTRGRVWTAVPLTRSQGEGHFSPIKSQLALALEILQAFPCSNFSRRAKQARRDGARRGENPSCKNCRRPPHWLRPSQAPRATLSSYPERQAAPPQAWLALPAASRSPEAVEWAAAVFVPRQAE